MVTALILRPSFSVSSVIDLLIAQTSSSVRYTCTCSAPGIGSLAASEPVATTSSSYSYVLPAAVSTVLPAVSIFTTRSPVLRLSASWSHMDAAPSVRSTVLSVRALLRATRS